MQKPYIIGATAAVNSAGLLVERQVGSTALDQIEILVDQPGGGVAAIAGRAVRDPAPAPVRLPAVEVAAVSAPADAPPADAAPLEEAPVVDPAEIGDVEMLLAYRSPWSDQPAGDGRPAWGRSGVGGPMMPPGPDMVGYDGNSYALARPINTRRGDDALAVALSQPVMFSTVPEPASWVSMIIGLALVGYSLRRRNRLPSVSS